MRRAIFIIAILFSCAAYSETRIIAANGSGSVEVVPDVIKVSYVVTKISRENVTDAKKEVDQIAADSIKALVAIGVMEEYITSPGLTVQEVPIWDENDNEPCAAERYVSRQLELELTDIELYNIAIQALIDSGISEIQSVKPDVSNYESLRLEALSVAAENAKSEANFLAKKLDAKLGPVHQIGQQKTRRSFSLQEIVVTARKIGSPSRNEIPYEFNPGTVEVSAEIYVEFELL